MKDFIDPFLYNVPTIDLHGYDRESASLKVLDFINESIKLKNEKIVIIHGIGADILRKEVYNILRKHKNVLEYRPTYYNRGQTEVKLNIKSKN